MKAECLNKANITLEIGADTWKMGGAQSKLIQNSNGKWHLPHLFFPEVMNTKFHIQVV